MRSSLQVRPQRPRCRNELLNPHPPQPNVLLKKVIRTREKSKLRSDGGRYQFQWKEEWKKKEDEGKEHPKQGTNQNIVPQEVLCCGEGLLCKGFAMICTLFCIFEGRVHPGMRGSIQSVLEGACSEGSVLLPFPSVILAGNSEKWDEREQEESKAFYFPCTYNSFLQALSFREFSLFLQ